MCGWAGIRRASEWVESGGPSAEVPVDEKPPYRLCSPWRNDGMLSPVCDSLKGVSQVDTVNDNEHASDGELKHPLGGRHGRRTRFNLPLERIKVTTANNFWQTAEAAGREGVLLYCNEGAGVTESPNRLHLTTDLRGTVILLPRVFLRYVIGLLHPSMTW